MKLGLERVIWEEQSRDSYLSPQIFLVIVITSHAPPKKCSVSSKLIIVYHTDDIPFLKENLVVPSD